VAVDLDGSARLEVLNLEMWRLFVKFSDYASLFD
jgi:hypothetical protein